MWGFDKFAAWLRRIKEPNRFLVFLIERELQCAAEDIETMKRCRTFVFIDKHAHGEAALQWLIDRQRFTNKTGPRCTVWTKHSQDTIGPPEGWVVGFSEDQAALAVEFRLRWG